MKTLKDELGNEVSIDGNLSDEEWNSQLLQHGRLIVEIAETSGDNFFNKYARFVN